MPTEIDGVVQYSIGEVQQIVRDKSARIIDVRTEEEYEDGHIPGVPLQPMQSIGEWMSELDPTQAYVFVCRSGGRSQQVASYLRQQGFARVANCAGGMLAWDGEVVTGSES